MSSSFGRSFQVQINHLESVLDDSAISWKKLVLQLQLAVYIFETYVSWRQYGLYSRPTPPAELTSHVDLETYKQSQAYGKDKAKFGFITSAAEMAMTAAVIHYDVYARVWTRTGYYLTRFDLPQSEAIHSVLFVIGMFLVRELPNIPFTLYKNFVVEEKHGFNKMTIGTFVKDTIIEWIVGFCIGAPLISGLIWVIRWAGDAFVAYVVAFLLVFQIVALVLYPTLIQPLFNKLTPLPEGALRDRVLALAGSLNFPLKHIYVIDGSKRSAHSNAYFYGIIPGGNKHIVIFDTLIEKSTHEEIEAVLAHELGHWAHMDTGKLLLIGQVQILLQMSIFTLFIHNVSLYRAFGFSAAPNLFEKALGTKLPAAQSSLPVIVGLELFQLVVGPLDAFTKFMLNSAVRSMEYAADRFAGELTRPPPTAAELKAAEVYNSAPAVAERMQANGHPAFSGAVETALLKVDPYDQLPYTELLKRSLIKLGIQNLSSMHNDSLYSAYHHSHPTLSERLHALNLIEAQLKKKH
ncbi:hypothetical protein K437DRAFT_255552 [Tilletiaria anomala UBC 951]|uniref:Ste24 endopeptidase n=1 Tax=Tilletiaria anomala (strain ATCC 24038 / CBS 436.72 / UBC 951) TaxID=1037660 RepID=A0A066W7D8_TILAU|nr:uncharacterized protein K437DRAFT_255552 [Tilletiaria anomala UBC 951]KDN48443.1 hypothetical protein K437DRAFT_255552 [Tilletiaria anomala UBC 951]